MGRHRPMTRAESMRMLEHEMGVVMRRIRRNIGERAKLVHPDLSAAGYSMLLALDEGRPRRSSELAELFSIDKGAVSRQVSQLGDLGFVTREPDPVDGRAQLLSITPKAQRLLADVTKQRRQRFDERLSSWDPEDLSDFVRALARYNETVD